MRQLFRDSFARITYFSRSIKHVGHLSCAWCGSKGKELHNKKSNFKFSLKQYASEADSIHPSLHWDAPKFCCKSCHDSYNE